MRKLFQTIAILLLLVFKIDVNAQIAFSQQYGGVYNEDGRWMEQLPDSGFIMTGGTTTYSNGQTDIWLVRTDAYGAVLWTKSIGGAFFDFANMVKPVSGGYIICGVTNRNGSDDAILVKTDLLGNTLWTRVIGDGGIQWFEAVEPTTDGGYACLGVNTSGTHGGYDFYLVKFDAAGTQEWEKNIGGGSFEIGNSIQQTADGGYILAGQTYSYGAGDGDYYLVKTNSLGVVQWEKTYAQPHLQECHYVQITPDGGYILVGDADTVPNGLGDTDVWMIRTDSLGSILWDKVYGGTKKDGGKTVENTSDGGFIIAGITRSFGLINPNYYLVKTDDMGNLQWQLTSYGTSHHDHAYRAIETSDGGFAEFGFFRNSSNAMDFALVKLGPSAGITKDIAVDEIVAPIPIICRSNDIELGVQLTNYGATNEINIAVTMSIDNGTTITNLTDTFVGSLTPNATTVLDFSDKYDFNLNGTYNLKAYIQHRNSDISYTNDTAYQTITVIDPTGDPATISAVRCTNGSLTLNSVANNSADSMFWFDAATNGNLIATGNSYITPSLSNTATYYVQSIKGKGNKVGMPDNSAGSGSTSSSGYLKFDSRKHFKLVSVLVYPSSSGNRTIELRNSGGNVLQSKTINLPSAPGGIRVYLNFDVPEGNDLQLGLGSSSASLFRNSSGAQFPYSVSQTVEIYGTNSSNNGTYYYFYDWYVFVPSLNCESNRIPVQARIGASTTSTFDVARCGNGTVTLTANSSGTVNWYTASSGGSPIASGNTFTTPSLNTTTTYYVEESTCPNRIAVDAIINPISAPPTSSNVSRCGPGSVTLTATSPDPIKWYNAAVNGTVMHSGSPFNTPFLSSTTTYYAVAGTSCPSTAVAVNAIINGAATPTVSGATACGPASVTLTANSPDPISWFTVPSGGSPIATTGTYTTPILAQPTTYYVEAGTSCPSPRVPVVANVNVTDPPVGTGASRCGAGSVVISAQSLASITWWTQATGGSQVGSGAIFTTPSLSTSTTYYAQASSNGCPSQRTAVTANVSVTSTPVITNGAHCGPGTVVLSATSSDTVYWYTAASGGSPIATGLSYTTPSLTNTTTYYAQASLACPSPRVPAVATIASQSADPVTTNGSKCGPGQVVLSASSPDPITWYDAPGGNVVGTGSPFSTPSISATTTFYAVAGISGCLSNPIAAVATINPLPTAPVVTGSQNCGPGQLTLNASASNPITWYSAATGGTLLSTGSSYTANFTTTTTVYVESNNGTCPSARVPVIATIYPLPFVNIGPPTLIINSGQSSVLNAGPGFASYLWSTGATTQTLTVSTAGTFFVTVTDGNSCVGSDTIVVSINTGIQDAANNLIQSIYPNPTTGVVHVTLNNHGSQLQLQILDVTGRIVLLDRFSDNGVFMKNYDLSAIAKGVYYIQVLSSEGNTTHSLVVQ